MSVKVNKSRGIGCRRIVCRWLTLKRLASWRLWSSRQGHCWLIERDTSVGSIKTRYTRLQYGDSRIITAVKLVERVANLDARDLDHVIVNNGIFKLTTTPYYVLVFGLLSILNQSDINKKSNAIVEYSYPNEWFENWAIIIIPEIIVQSTVTQRCPITFLLILSKEPRKTFINPTWQYKK